MPDTGLPFDPLRPRELPKPKPRRSFTARQVAAVFIKYEGRCAKCNEKVALDGYHIDHINPLASLGKHELENWQLLCIECHTGKTKRDNFEAKKSARIRGEAGQQKRRRESGPRLQSRNDLKDRKGRGFDKSLRKKMDGSVVPR